MFKVSAIMPTRGRPALAARALQCFLSQTYWNRDLIIVDDADNPSFPGALPSLDGIQYVRNAERLSIPAKLNQCCQRATGEVICRFDDDDWSAPERMIDQVQRLMDTGVAVTGYHSILFLDERTPRAVKYCGHDRYALGTSLCFLKSFWASHPFRRGPHHPSIGEDNEFIADARAAGQLIACDAGVLMVARAHAGNTSLKTFSGLEYQPVPLKTIPAVVWQAL